MRHTKRLLAQVFGNRKHGLNYLKRLRAGRAAPSLFVYSEDEGSQEFAQWLTAIAGPDNTALVDEQRFRREGRDIPASTIIVQDVWELSSDLLDAVVKKRNQQNRISVALRIRPKLLDYLNDPTIVVGNVEGFRFADVKDELDKLLKKMG